MTTPPHKKYKIPKMKVFKAPDPPKPIPKINLDFHINETTRTDAGMPVDFTFKRYTKIEKTGPEFASTGRLGKVDKGDKQRKYLTRGVWLNNNLLADIQNIHTLVDSVLEYPERLSFLDLSCNQLVVVHDDILAFPNLTILYLHGNNILHIKEIFKLRALRKLHNFTLYGNPIYDDASLGNNRSVVAYLVPQLKKLDYITITSIERERPVAAKVMRFIEAGKKHVAAKVSKVRKVVESKPEEEKKKKVIKGGVGEGVECPPVAVFMACAPCECD